MREARKYLLLCLKMGDPDYSAQDMESWRSLVSKLAVLGEYVCV